MPIRINPSILSADFARLGEEAARPHRVARTLDLVARLRQGGVGQPAGEGLLVVLVEDGDAVLLTATPSLGDLLQD